MERQILLLGDPRLYETSEEVTREELEELRPVFTDMFDCIKGIRRDYGFGMMELMDDCMSFPKLLVRVRRHRHCILRYLDENWTPQEMQMEDDMSELIQHEYDHLNGILATMRAIDNKSFVMKR